ncbi:uncharacterized protein B0H18DRAFT_1114990 [Fomitopsis serialis]|uniref:uncharacterized protein n=1 Tax=Fomitopsis serialis TaxID=139415 RepID=UPI00200860F1|nr:uncharacterized protein B0H18DRAFT_1114990 [Neoantrodia serialis]KAH9934251.1 hypothetical protein B0H18DRAFT_1114990 [Neoantrodia serialis]
MTRRITDDAAQGKRPDSLTETARPSGPITGETRRNAPARTRTRNLLESVQAHLSIRPSPDHGSTKAGTSSSAVPSRGVGGAAKRNELLNPTHTGRSSLLERLSDPALVLPAEEIVRSSSDGYAEQPQHDVAVRSPPLASPRLQASPVTEAEMRRSVPYEVGSASNHIDEPIPPASSALRALLLSKLEAERRNHSQSTAATPDDLRRATGHVSSARNASDSIATEERGVVNGQSHNSAERAAEREAILRTQAQLRMRLAAARKTAVCGTEGGLTAGINATSMHGDGDGNEALSQEELLRSRLAERRGSSAVRM